MLALCSSAGLVLVEQNGGFILSGSNRVCQTEPNLAPKNGDVFLAVSSFVMHGTKAERRGASRTSFQTRLLY